MYSTFARSVLRVILAAASYVPLYIGVALSTNLSAQNSGFYVSSESGNDSWSGTLSSPNSLNSDGPFKTLAKAQAAMRSSGTKTTVVRAGTYSIASVWRFNPSDSNETWVAYPGETVTLDGGSTGGVDLNNFLAGGVNHVTFEGLTFLNMGTAAMNIGGDDSITFGGTRF